MPWRPRYDGRQGTYKPPRERGRYDAEWRRKRAAFLAGHRHCAECGAAATVADHVIPRERLIERAVPDPDEAQYLQPLCQRCHGRKSLNERASGPGVGG